MNIFFTFLANAAEETILMPENIEYGGLFWKTILTLIGIIIVFVIVFYLLRKGMGIRSTRMNYLKNIKILEKRPLSPKSMLYLVEVAGRQFLLAESQLEVRPITEVATVDTEDPQT
ncbi:MAG: hypothetical protein ChlgKO_10050 [Chlamydiales bacterium]